MVDTYIKNIASITKPGDARENSYYPAFAALTEKFPEEVSRYARVVTVITETIIIQRSLDDLFGEVETTLLEVTL